MLGRRGCLTEMAMHHPWRCVSRRKRLPHLAGSTSCEAKWGRRFRLPTFLGAASPVRLSTRLAEKGLRAESIPALVLRPGLAEQLRRLAPGREFQGAHSVSVANVGVGAMVQQGYHAIPVPAPQRCRQRRAAAGIPGIPIRTPVDRHPAIAKEYWNCSAEMGVGQAAPPASCCGRFFPAVLASL